MTVLSSKLGVLVSLGLATVQLTAKLDMPRCNASRIRAHSPADSLDTGLFRPQRHQVEQVRPSRPLDGYAPRFELSYHILEPVDGDAGLGE